MTEALWGSMYQNVHKFTVRSSESGKETICQLVNATIYKVCYLPLIEPYSDNLSSHATLQEAPYMEIFWNDLDSFTFLATINRQSASMVALILEPVEDSTWGVQLQDWNWKEVMGHAEEAKHPLDDKQCCWFVDKDSMLNFGISMQ